MKAVVAAFNQEKALVGAFSVITNLRMQLFEALLEAQPSLDPEPEAEQREAEDEEEDESFPLLNETSFLGPPQPQPGAGSKSLRRQYR